MADVRIGNSSFQFIPETQNNFFSAQGAAADPDGSCEMDNQLLRDSAGVYTRLRSQKDDAERLKDALTQAHNKLQSESPNLLQTLLGSGTNNEKEIRHTANLLRLTESNLFDLKRQMQEARKAFQSAEQDLKKCLGDDTFRDNYFSNQANLLTDK